MAYPFGFGLSYATFQYSDLKVQPTVEGFNVRFVLSNNSSIDAEEVAQVYVSRPSSHIERPMKELKGFQRVALKAGERKTIFLAVSYLKNHIFGMFLRRKITFSVHFPQYYPKTESYYVCKISGAKILKNLHIPILFTDYLMDSQSVFSTENTIWIVLET